MELVTYTEPIIKEDENRPHPLDGQSFPYTTIANPRRFEELLYSIYKSKIEEGHSNEYDGISLMSGVADQGKDIVMFREGKTRGIIQCKKYSNNLAKGEFGKEITKLILYSLLDDRIIPDRNDFTYFIAVAKDFTADCRSFIDDFTAKIQQEDDLNSWISDNLKMPSLQSLVLNDCRTDVLDILSRINVKKIVPQDLDLELKDKPGLQQLFFAVRSVTDNKQTDKILSILKGELSIEEVSSQLNNGSVSLMAEKNTFEGIEDSHILRSETMELITWLQSETKKDRNGNLQNICLLAAPAGYGKTVILKDFFSECQSLNIPVLGLKTDKLYSYTITDLQKSIGLSLPVFDFIERCKALYPLTVIVIDQIDALSQSMSSDRRFLDIFKSFIDRFENDTNVKVVISVRNQDLNYDSNLRSLKRNNTIQVGRLKAEQVLGQLEKIGVLKDQVSSKLLELLTIPNNLNIFSRIVSSEKSLKITTIEELYTELWHQKVLQVPARVKTDKTKLRNALYTIAGKMFKTQRITISVHQVEDFSDEINYLESEQLIKGEQKQLQFFHQSFYDFVFAKQFVENGENLIVYIKQSEQSIHIRSAVKMIISYLRDYDPAAYDSYAMQIIADEEIFFHIKHIVLLNTLSQLKPTQAEKNLVKSCVEYSWSYLILFFDHAYGANWLEFALDNSLFCFLEGEADVIRKTVPEVTEEILKDMMLKLRTFFLQKHIVTNDKNAWQYFSQVKDPSVIQKILYFVTDWSDSYPFEMLAKCPDFIRLDTWSFYHILENIAKYDVDFVLKSLAETLPNHYQKGNSKGDYNEQAVLKIIAKQSPEKLYPLLYEILNKDINRKSELYDDLIRDWAYSHTDLQDEEHMDGREFLYQLLAICLKKVASSNSVEFKKFFNKEKLSRHYAVHRLILFSLSGSESMYTAEILELFGYFKGLGLLTSGDDLEYELRSSVEKAFSSMDDTQKKVILGTIREYNDQKELRTWTDDKGKISLHFRWGLAKYFWLLRIPPDVVKADIELYRAFLELQRKFADREDTPMKRSVIAGVVGSPVPANALKFMKKSHWLKSFEKYDADRSRTGSDFLKGGKTELSSTFLNAVEKDPSREKLETIQAVVESDSIPIDFAISGLYGWTKSEGDLSEILPACISILKKNPSGESTYLTSVIGTVASLETTDTQFVSYLINRSLRFAEEEPDPHQTDDIKTSVNGLITKAINTRFGSAANYLTSVADVRFKDEVFDAVIHILKNGPAESRAAIYFRFYYLTRLDRDKAYEVFTGSLEKENNIHVIASAIQSLQYFRSNGLEIFSKPLGLLIESGLTGKEDSDYLFTILFGSYLHGQKGAQVLLQKLINYGNCSSSKAIGDIIKYYYTVKGSKDKNDELLQFIISKVGIEDFDDIAWSFHDASHVALSDIYPFVKSFIQSKYFKLTDNFVGYLTSQCGKFPFLAIELFELAVGNNEIDVDQSFGYYIDEKATKFIVAAFEALTGNDEHSKDFRKKLLQSFDKMVTDLRFRRNQEKILSELI